MVSPIADLVGREVTNIGLQESCGRQDARRKYYTVTASCKDGKPVLVPESVLKPTDGEADELEEGEHERKPRRRDQRAWVWRGWVWRG